MEQKNVRTLTNSEKQRYWAERFLEDMKKAIALGGDEFRIVRKNGSKLEKVYTGGMENLVLIDRFIQEQLLNSKMNVLSAERLSSYLVRFAGFVQKPFIELTKKDIFDFLLTYQNMSEHTKAGVRRKLKPFFRWLGKTEIVKDLVCGVKNSKFPEILELQEIQKMIEVCENHRDRALVSVFYDSGARLSEILDLRIKDITFDEYGAVVIVSGKTGDRRLRLISSVPDIKAWLNVHPRKNDSNAPLFCSFTSNNKGNPLNGGSLCVIFKNIAKNAGITKNVYPHLFRHSRATHLAKFLKESELRIFFGWAKGSPTVHLYNHLSGTDVEDKLLALNGIKTGETQKPPIIPTNKCYRCSEINSIGNKFCWKCSAPLTDEGIKEAERVKDFVGNIIPALLDNVRAMSSEDSEKLKAISEILKKELGNNGKTHEK